MDVLFFAPWVEGLGIEVSKTSLRHPEKGDHPFPEPGDDPL